MAVTPTSDPVVRALRVLGPLVAVAFGAVVVSGLAQGTFLDEGGQIVELLWGRITLVDVYLAFSVPAAWAFLREERGTAIAVAAGIVVLGSVVIFAHLGWAAFRSADRRELLLGRMA